MEKNKTKILFGEPLLKMLEDDDSLMAVIDPDFLASDNEHKRAYLLAADDGRRVFEIETINEDEGFEDAPEFALLQFAKQDIIKIQECLRIVIENDLLSVHLSNFKMSLPQDFKAYLGDDTISCDHLVINERGVKAVAHPKHMDSRIVTDFIDIQLLSNILDGKKLVSYADIKNNADQEIEFFVQENFADRPITASEYIELQEEMSTGLS